MFMRVIRVKHINVLLIAAILSIGIVGLVRRSFSSESGATILPSRNANTSPGGSASPDAMGQSKRLQRPAGHAINLDDISQSFFEIQPKIPTLASDGTITQDAFQSVGVPDIKRSAVQRVIDKLLAKTESAMRARIRENETESDPSIGLKVYKVAAAEEEALENIRQSAQELSDIIGAREAASLMSRIEPSRHLGGMGMYDVVISTEPAPGKSPDDLWTSGTVSDPKSGKTIFRFGVTSSRQRDYIGGLLNGFEPTASTSR